MRPSAAANTMGSIGIAASIAKIAFIGLLIVGALSGELRAKGFAVFLALGLLVEFGFQRVIRGADFMTSALAVIDIALVFAIFKGDVRIG